MYKLILYLIESSFANLLLVSFYLKNLFLYIKRIDPYLKRPTSSIFYHDDYLQIIIFTSERQTNLKIELEKLKHFPKNILMVKDSLTFLKNDEKEVN